MINGVTGVISCHPLLILTNMNSTLRGIAFQWVYDTLNKHRGINQEDGDNIKEDDLSRLIEDMAYDTEEEFAKYCESGGKSIPFSDHIGIKAWLAINGKRFKTLMTDDTVDDDTRSIVIEWLDSCYHPSDIIDSFRYRLQAMSEYAHCIN